jgi:hypothetical protein
MKHIHKYERKKYGNNGCFIYKCMIPGCTHFVYESLIINRRSLCWRCDKEFVITKLLKKPHCDDCTRGKKAQNDLEVLNTFKKLMLEGVK